MIHARKPGAEPESFRGFGGVSRLNEEKKNTGRRDKCNVRRVAGRQVARELLIKNCY